MLYETGPRDWRLNTADSQRRSVIAVTFHRLDHET